MKTELLNIKGNWEEVVDDCRQTMDKPPLGHEPSTKFKREILMSEHTPIRDIILRWRWPGIKSWIATHFTRHHHLEPRVTSQRNDRQSKYNRDEAPQAAPVDITIEGNVQACIDMERKRLCNKAHTETRAYAKNLKRTIHEVEPEIADVFVPNCIYRGGCPEQKPCGWYDGRPDSFLTRHPEITVHTSLQERYDIYNREFYNI